MLEHLDRNQAILFLREARRVLRSGGVLRIAVPDILRRVQQYLESRDADAFFAATLLAAPSPQNLLQRMQIPIGETQIEEPGLMVLSERAAESVYVEAHCP
jgi:hypothetical protein